jgi:hypothetical protein
MKKTADLKRSAHRFELYTMACSLLRLAFERDRSSKHGSRNVEVSVEGNDCRGTRAD